VPLVENWMLGMCDVAECINDVRDPETIRFSNFQNSKTEVKTKFTFNKSIYPLTINLIKYKESMCKKRGVVFVTGTLLYLMLLEL
jgi:hypothetical protein